MLPESNCSSASTKTIQKKRVEMQCDLSGVKHCIITLITYQSLCCVNSENLYCIFNCYPCCRDGRSNENLNINNACFRMVILLFNCLKEGNNFICGILKKSFEEKCMQQKPIMTRLSAKYFCTVFIHLHI